MIARTIGVALVLAFAPLALVQADIVGDEEEIEVPAPMPEKKPVKKAAPMRPVAPEPVSAPPPAYVEIRSTSIAAGLGFSWGNGTLNYEGTNYPFSVKGFSVIDIGIAQMISEGGVANLEQVSDFEGRYVALEAGVAAGAGVSTLKMRNDKGVVITLRSKLKGVQLALAAEGFNIALK